MSDKILQMFFDIDRWSKAIEKGVLKDIRKDQLIRLADEHTRMAMADAMMQGKYEISPPHTAQIPKENGEFRTVYVNEPIDRVVLGIANDPLFRLIASQGDVPNRRLFRRWVMAQMFRMMASTDYRSGEPVGVTEMIHHLGYEYQWKMLLKELHAQMKMEGRDMENFTDRNRWFNVKVVAQMAEDHIKQLKKRVDSQKTRKCKGVPYKRVGSRNIFVEDLEAKVYRPLQALVYGIREAKDAARLYAAANRFDGQRFKMPYGTPQCKEWVNAYKGAGAFFTMQNLIRFHGCTAVNDQGKRLDKYQSLAFLTAKAEAYKDGEGWRLLAVLKKMLDDNNIDIRKKMAQWRKK